MPTQFNVHFLAEHPLKMGFCPPHNVITDELEAIAERHGMVPISSSVARMDDEWGEHESQAWVPNVPDALILEVAKLLDGFVAQAIDPESDIVTSFGEAVWDEPPAVAVAEALLAHRRSQKEQGDA